MRIGLKRWFWMWATGWLLAAGSGVAQTQFVSLRSDGAWTWFNDPRALFHNGQLYFGYVRRSDSKTAVSVFDLQSGQVTDLWNSGFTQLDDHNNPGLLARLDGKLLAIYARHGTDQTFSYRLSLTTNPVSPADWAAEQRIAATGAGITYANPYQLAAEPGVIYNYARNLNFNPTVFTSSDGGATWSEPKLFIQSGRRSSIRPYVKYGSDGVGRIDFLYTDGHPNTVTNSLYHLYYQGGEYRQTDGTKVRGFAELPIRHDAGERGAVIYRYNAAPQGDPNQWIPAGRAWCWEVASGTNGRPWCVFTVQRDAVTGTNWFDDRLYYYYARWTGREWQKRFIAQAGRPLYRAEEDYAGGICLDPGDARVVYISSNAEHPFQLADTTAVPLRAGERYELWRGLTEDGGLTFAWTPVTMNSAVDNLRPYVPRGQGGVPAVLWLRGTYSAYTAYACGIVGQFASLVPGRPTEGRQH